MSSPTFCLGPCGSQWGDFMYLHKHRGPLPVVLQTLVTLACVHEKHTRVFVAVLCNSIYWKHVDVPHRRMEGLWHVYRVVNCQ